MDLKKKVGVIFGVLIILVSLIATVILLIVKDDNSSVNNNQDQVSNSSTDTTKTSETKEASKTSSSSTSDKPSVLNPPNGKWLNKDDMKKSAVYSLENILKESIAISGKDNDEYAKFMSDLTSDPTLKSIPQKYKDYFYITDFTDSSDAEGSAEFSSYVAVIHMARVIDAAVKKMGNDSIKPVTDNAWQSAYADLRTQRVFIPLSIYMGSTTEFNMEMFYIDGAWKIDPYSFLGEILVANSVTQAMSGDQSSTATKETPNPNDLLDNLGGN